MARSPYAVVVIENALGYPSSADQKLCSGYWLTIVPLPLAVRPSQAQTMQCPEFRQIVMAVAAKSQNLILAQMA